ncbi:STAS domain-containing protein [Streptomyces roseifaciens]
MAEWQGTARIRAVGRWSVLELAGEIDLAAVPEAEALLARLLVKEQPAVVVDLIEVTFFDCALLGLLSRGRTRVLGAGGSFDVLCIRPWSLRLLRVAGLLEVFCPVASLADLADLDALGGRRPRGARA